MNYDHEMHNMNKPHDAKSGSEHRSTGRVLPLQQFQLPPFLTLSSLRRVIRPPIRAKRYESGLYPWVPELAPPKQDPGMQLEGRRVQAFDAEGACGLAALVQWLKNNGASSYSTIFNPGKLLGSSGFAIPEEGTNGFFVDSVLASFPVAAESDANAVARSVSSGLRNALLSGPARSLLSYGVFCCLEEFVLESVLNIYDHAYVTGRKGDRLFVMYQIRSSDDAVARLKDDRSGQAISNWLNWCINQGATAFLEIAIADSGLGIPNTLCEAFTSTSEYRQLRKRTVTEVHDRIIRYALDPYTTRKGPTDFANPTHRRTWRGLYRVHFHAAHCSCALRIQSVFGQQLRLYADSVTTSGSPLGARGSWAWPGTCMSIRIPLPVPKHTIQWPSGDMRDADHLVLLPCSLRESLEQSIEKYRHSVEDAVADHVPGGLPNAPQLVAVVHPSTELPSPGAIPGHASVDTDTLMSEVASLAAIGARPAELPVHVLLRFDSPRDPTHPYPRNLPQGDFPAIAGIVNAGENRINWFARISNTALDHELALARVATIHGVAPPWLKNAAQLYPGILQYESVPASNRWSIRLVLPTHLGPDTFKKAITKVILHLAEQSTPPDWFWKAASGEAAYILTASGKYVSQFVSAYALVVEEPVIARCMSMLLLDMVRPRSAGKTILVPCCDGSSYLLAKHLLRERGETERVLVCLPGDLPAALQADDEVHIFCDVVHSCRLMTQRLSEVALMTPQAKLAGVAVVIDARPLGQPESPVEAEPLKYSAIVRWPFPSPISADVAERTESRISVVDVMSNEAIAVDKERLSNYFITLLSDAAKAFGTILLRSERFQYGLQQFSGRWHLIRMPTVSLLRDQDAMPALVDWVIGNLSNGVKPGEDIVFCVREDDPRGNEPRLFALWEGLARRVCEGMRLLEWKGNGFIAAVPTTRRERNLQRLHHDIGRTIRQAKCLEAESAESLFQPLSRTRPSKSFCAVYLDNSAITGRAIQEFALAMSDSEPSPRAIWLCPVADRLNPVEFLVLRRTPVLSAEKSGERHSIQFRFSSLIQLRIRSYDRCGDSEVLQAAHEFVKRSAWANQPLVSEYLIALQEILTLVEGGNAPVPLQFPLCIVSNAAVRVSIHAIELRHLLGLHQQGIPVIRAWLRVLRELLHSKDASLLVVFALEPELLRDRTVAGAFLQDVGEMAEQVLRDTSAAIGLRSNALWVLYQITDEFVSRRHRIAEACIDDPVLCPQWMASCAACSRLAQVLDVALTLSSAKTDVGRKGIAAIRQLRFMSPMRSGEVQSTAQAQEALRRYFEKTGQPHRLQGAWLSVLDCGRSKTADVSGQIWDDAVTCARDFIAPAMQATAYLLKDDTELARKIKDAARDVLTGINQAHDAFDSSGNIDTESLLNVRRLSASTGVSHILCPINAYPRSLVEATDPERGQGMLAYVIPQVVCEPVSALLYELGVSRAQSHRRWRLIRGDPWGDSSTTGDLIEEWRRGLISKILPIAWTATETIMKHIYRPLFTDNLRYADPTVDILLSVWGNDRMLHIKLIDEPLAIPCGHQSGIPLATKALADLGGRIVSISDRGLKPFSLEIELPCEWIELA